MEAKEKAEELLDKFMNSDNMIFLIEGAKECALIAVDELIKEYKSMSDLESILLMGTQTYSVVDKVIYWQEVKREIEQYKNGKK